jgi:hypothetical protein
MVRGDWVLFHPVYTQEEIKAVEVGLEIAACRDVFEKPSGPSP